MADHILPLFQAQAHILHPEQWFYWWSGLESSPYCLWGSWPVTLLDLKFILDMTHCGLFYIHTRSNLVKSWLSTVLELLGGHTVTLKHATLYRKNCRYIESISHLKQTVKEWKKNYWRVPTTPEFHFLDLKFLTIMNSEMEVKHVFYIDPQF